MTHEQSEALREDIAYMRAMAHEGRHTPLLGGSILIAAGLIFGAASIGHYLMETGYLALPPAALSVLWLGAMGLFFVILTVLNRGVRRKPGALSPINRAVGTAWMSVGLVIFVSALAMGVISWKYQTAVPMLLFPCLIFALYGAGWAVSGAMSGVRWQWWLAIACWVAAPLLALLSGEPEMWLAYAGGLFLFAMVPGFAMRRQEPAEVI